MSSTYTSAYRFDKQGTGDNDGTWGVILNTQVDLIEDSIAGVVSITLVDGDNVLSVNNGVSDESRHKVIALSGALTTVASVIIPDGEGVHIVRNMTTGGKAVTFKTSSGSGFVVPSSTAVYLYATGTTVIPGSTPVFADGTLAATTFPTLSTTTLNASSATFTSVSSSVITTGILNGTTGSFSTLNTAVASVSALSVTNLNVKTTVSASIGKINSLTTNTISTTNIITTNVSTSTFTGSTATVNWTVAPPVSLTYATTLAPDFALGNNFVITLTGDLTLAGPSNPTSGQGGVILFQQDATGNRAITWGTNYLFQGGNEPILTSAGSSLDVLSYYVTPTGTVICNLGKGFA